MEDGGVFTIYSHGAFPILFSGGTHDGITTREQLGASFAADFTPVNTSEIVDIDSDTTNRWEFGKHYYRFARCLNWCLEAEGIMVYGTGAFLETSAVCAAALFAGTFTHDGGVVELH